MLVARHAMATRFEIVLHGSDPTSLRAAGEEALDEIDRLEGQLSLYQPGSEIARLNREAARRPVRVTPALFQLLVRARDLSAETGGAFDITIAPLVRCWGFMNGTGAMPEPSLVEQARAQVGMQLVELDADNLTVHFARDGVMIDLGAIGKGYAIDRAADVLREAGITSALVHGGTSTAYAIGRQPDGSRWKVAVTPPTNEPGARPLAVVELEDESLSVSAVWGRSFRVGEKTYGHILDPRTGFPAEAALLTAVVLASATESDALSTALLAAPELLNRFVENHPQIRCLVASGRPDAPPLSSHGLIAERF
jgi:thiamine biosynthesis lipoprotein